MSEDKKNGKQNKTVKPFDPMTLRGVTVRNRIWLPPMDTYSALAQDGKPTPFHYQHYVSRAMGGFGMIIMEATAVAPGGRISPCDLGLWDDGQMDAWRWIVADAKAVGATMAVQLNHAIRLAPPARSVHRNRSRGSRWNKADGGRFAQAPTHTVPWLVRAR